MSSSKFQSFFNLSLVVAGSMTVAVGGLCVVQATVPQHVLVANHDVGGNYLQTLGAIYGVLLAFVVFVVWTQRNEATKLVEQEANGLRDIVRLACAIGGPVRRRMLEATLAYATAVIEREWPAMQKCTVSLEASQRLRELWEIIEAIEPHRPRETALYAEAIRSFNELGDARADRLTSSGLRLPASLRLFVVAGGVSTVGSMYFFTLESFPSLALMTAIMAGAVSHLVYLIHDLDSPYGDWQVTPAAIDRVREKVHKELAEAGAA